MLFQGATHLHELNERLGTIMIRRRKQDVLSQLPQKRRQMVPIELSDQVMSVERSGPSRVLSDQVRVE